jgi:UDP-N-acetylglucosamine acyltransferase
MHHIADGARLGVGVEIGPYAVIGDGVVVGDRCRIGSHACLLGPLELGEDCVVGHAAAIGHDPQVKGRNGPFGGVRIGARSVFREFSQVHGSMSPDGWTVIGHDFYLMATAHVAHDCVVGDHVVVCNGTLLAGHATVGSRAFISGLSAVHQFGRVGELAMVAGGTILVRDVPPFCVAVGSRPSALEGLNTVGLRRAGMTAETRRALQTAYRTLFRSDLPLDQRLAAVERGVPEVDRLVAFCEQRGRRTVLGFGVPGPEPLADGTAGETADESAD